MATQACSTYTAGSAYTTDIDTTVSDLKTVFTESMAAQSKMLQQFMATSQQQQQQLMVANQNQQASTNQLLQHISSLMAHLVPATTPPPTYPPDNPTPATASQVNQSPLFSSKTKLQQTPKKRPAYPDHHPDSHRGSTPLDSDTQIWHSDHDSTGETSTALPLLDPDPSRRV
jgi:hypothetical protein